MKTIPLSGSRGKGKVILVEDSDYTLVSSRKWYAQYSGSKKTMYAYTDIYSNGSNAATTANVLEIK